MARFRGTVQGDRGEASRLGHRGLRTTADGWKIGGALVVEPDVDSEKKQNLDKVRFVLTGGSEYSYKINGLVATAWEAPFFADGKVHKFIRFPDCFGGKTYVLLEGQGIEDPDRWQELSGFGI